MGHQLKADLKMSPEALGVKLSVTAGQEISVGESETPEVDILVSIANTEGKARTPADVVCVVDISGSMGSRAEVQNEKGESESHGLNLLDIVKHAVRTVFHALGPEDRLCVVAFDHCAEVSLELTKMDAAGKALAEAAVEALHPRGSTDLWAGLKEALGILSRRGSSGKPEEEEESQRLGSILLLTDGCPNRRPSEGELSELQKYREACGGQLPAVVNTFGFGYNLDSALLRDLAVEGDGTYAFIPDSGFVGTCFVHALGNLLVTAHKDAVLHLEPLNGAEVRTKLVDGNIGARGSTFAEYPASVDAAAGRTSLRLGTLQHGQAREVVVRMAGIPSPSAADAQAGPPRPYLSATLEFRPVLTAISSEAGLAGKSSAPGSMQAAVRVLATKSAAEQDDALLRLAPAACRQATVEMLRELVKKRSSSGEVPESDEMLRNLVLEIRSSPAAETEETKALLEDLEGQVTEALSRDDWYRKWGRHYLPSLARAHQLQMCNNFKDPGVQGYGGKLFTELRDEADDLFVSLPPPKPSLAPSRGNCSAPIVSMAAYHNACGG